MSHRPFMVVLHDVTPIFSGDLEIIIDEVIKLVGSSFSCAIVPCWKGDPTRQGDATWQSGDQWQSCPRLIKLLRWCDECLLHGFTHHRDHRPGWVSHLTRRSDEFGGLTIEQIQSRIDAGRQSLLQQTEIDVNGLLPPAWQLPADATTLLGLDYVLRFTRLESCTDASDTRPLATWSFDWGWCKRAAWCGEALGHLRLKAKSDAIPCVAIHPVDLQRGWLPRILRLIGDLIDRGYQPVNPSNLFQCTAS